jgi:hypothetical protein
VFGGLELAGAAASAPTPAVIAAAPILVVNGLDNLYAGLRQAITGETIRSVAAQLLQLQLEQGGVRPEAAEFTANTTRVTTDIVAGFALTTPAVTAARRIAPVQAGQMNTRALNLGSGSNPMRGVVNIDLAPGPGANAVANAGRLPFANGQFTEVHAVNPYAFNPVSAETARVMQPGGLLRVTGTPNNRFAQPLTPAQARAAGFELVESTPIQPAHQFGTQRFSDGRPLSSANSTTTVYRRLE